MTITLDFDASATDSHTRRTLSELSLSLIKKKKIVVVTGAGISCSCGIPDFRSSDGLYNLVKERYPDVVLKGRDLFDASLFRDTTSTSVFYSFIAELKKKIDDAKPSSTHHFIKTLDSKNKLLRSYTQNIDGLEEKAGLLGSSCESAKSMIKGKSNHRFIRNVQLHGDIHRVRCMSCSADFPCAEEHINSFLQGVAPDCPECVSRSEARVARAARALKIGTLRPAIVLYDEPHPLGDEIGTIQTSDVSKKPDMLIIMGTSLKVHGFKKLVKDFAKTIHASSATTAVSTGKKPFKVIFVNRTPPSSEWSDIIDYHVAGDTDAWASKVIEDWKKMRPSDWEIQQTLVATDDNVTGLKTVKASGSKSVKAQKKPAPKKQDENVAPADPFTDVPTTGKASEQTKSNAPLSPSKRRQKSSHYDDVESSPSKRQSCATYKGPVMPSTERKLLFTETTNNIPIPVPYPNDPAETSKMDISLCDLSMRDVFSEEDECVEDVLGPVFKLGAGEAGKKVGTGTKSGKAAGNAKGGVNAKVAAIGKQPGSTKAVRARAPSASSRQRALVKPLNTARRKAKAAVDAAST